MLVFRLLWLYKYSFPCMKVLGYVEFGVAYCVESRLTRKSVAPCVFNWKWAVTAAVDRKDSWRDSTWWPGCNWFWMLDRFFYNGTEALRPAGNCWEYTEWRWAHFHLTRAWESFRHTGHQRYVLFQVEVLVECYIPFHRIPEKQNNLTHLYFI